MSDSFSTEVTPLQAPPDGMNHCPECGALIPTDRADQPCRRCLLLLADVGLELPERIGEYTPVRLLGHGAMGTVYLARQQLPQKLVAIKVLRQGLLDERVMRWFGDEIEILGQLEHDNIVPIYDGRGLHHSPPFYTMRWIDGSTLDDDDARAAYASPLRAAALMITIAGAVQFAHQRGVLHRDLKPNNILIAQDGQPFVSDFGLARALHAVGTDGPRHAAGSLGYMSPEQATATSHELTVASDVYSLGAVFYDLLTGSPPRRPRDLTHLIEQIRNEPIIDPSAAAVVPADLARVCMCALETDPELRYRSAAELADDLKRVLAFEPPQPRNAEEPGRLLRMSYWARRHAVLVAIGVALLASLINVFVLAGSAGSKLKAQIRSENQMLAGMQADMVTAELRRLADEVRTIAHNPAVAELSEWTSPYAAPEVLSPYFKQFDLICVFTMDGTLRARYPKPSIEHYDWLDFSYRDYFRNMMANDVTPDRVYVSRAFVSTGDRSLQFGFSAPLFDAGGHRVGTLMTGIAAKPTFGALRMDPGTGTTVLLGARDRESGDERFRDALSVLAAPGLIAGTDVPVDARISRRICGGSTCQPEARDQFESKPAKGALTFEDYPDPITHAPSIAAVARVGRTGLWVVAATPIAFIESLVGKTIEEFFARELGAVVLGLLTAFALFYLAGFLGRQPTREHRGTRT